LNKWESRDRAEFSVEMQVFDGRRTVNLVEIFFDLQWLPRLDSERLKQAVHALSVSERRTNGGIGSSAGEPILGTSTALASVEPRAGVIVSTG
jgi:hypothetical protein